ncbi:MAG: glycosyltransferase, partial [Candidatus Thermoplasmatota archaeon]|nr:glycosyltransferase [Candidatus Thermoplasmatota archaeon]
FTILFVGRFVEKKGIRYLIEACSILKERGMDFRLLLVGDGPLRNDYGRRIRKCGIEDRTLIKGPVPQQDILEELKKADVFVLPSVVVKNGDRDILPNSLKEAMAMKVPVITTDISGIGELVEDGRTGLLIRPGSPMDIVEAVQKVISDPEMMNGMVEEGRKKIERDFNIEVEAKKLNAVFHEAMKST